MQAVQASDYAIGQFEYLQKLLLVHGFWGYIRIATFLNYYFYKNMQIAMVSMFFAFYNGYSGLGFFATILDMLFNAAWTSWPVLLSTPQDRYIEKNTVYANPTVYQHT